MIDTMSNRAKELETIEKIKQRLKHIKETPVKVSPRTFLLVREGKDPDKAVAEFRQKQLEATKREFNNELQY